METNLCQSCGMPMNETELFGSNQDGTLNEEYCIYCFKAGSFTQDVTMGGMIDHCLEYLNDFNKDSEVKYSPEEARKEMLQFFPSLKRWKVN